MNTVKKFLLLLFTAIFICSSLYADPGIKKKILIGGLFSITGGWSTLGNSSAAALQLAAEDVNAYLIRRGINFQVQPVLEDTQLVPQTALEKLQALSKLGVRIVVGPQSSAEVAAIRSFAEDNGILLISQSSTAGSLAIGDDNVFRLCPDDDLEGEAISALMYDDGVRTVKPIWREDAGNGGLEIATRSDFTNLGGTVATGVSYVPTTSDFTSTITALESQVNAAVAANSGDHSKVGIYLAAFDEVVAIFQLASSNSTLNSVRWYGSDGVALSQALLSDPTAAAFAQTSGYPNPTFGLDQTARVISDPVSERIKNITGTDPEAFALNVYDAVWIAARTVVLKNGVVTVDYVREQLPEFASSYFGTTGWTILNPAGDRRFGNFDFWAIREVQGSRQWTRVAHYNSASKELIRD